MYALLVFSVILAWLMGKGFVFALLVCLLSAPIVPHSGGRRFPLPLGAPVWLLQLPFGGLSTNSGQGELTLSGGVAGKAGPFQSS